MRVTAILIPMLLAGACARPAAPTSVAGADEPPDAGSEAAPRGAEAKGAPQASDADPVLATIGDRAIRQSAVAPSVAMRIYRHEVDIYSLLERETERMVERDLLAAEAERRGLSVEAMLEHEVNDEAPEATDAEIDAWLAEHPDEAGVGPEARPRIALYLTERRRTEARMKFMEGLREQAGFHMVLAPPKPPRTQVDVTGAPARGPEDAPVTLVHFASFSTVEAARSAGEIERLEAAFPGRIREVYRSFLAGRDERGLAAALVARAASREGRFWELHDRLYALGGRWTLDDLEKVAVASGLRAGVVQRAMQDRGGVLALKNEIDLGLRTGVDRPPVIFVNGRYYSPTFSYDELETLVREELRRATR